MKSIISLSLLFAFISTSAQEKQVSIGDKVKHFSAIADDGSTWESKGILGKKNLVVYFYPAAMTGGCTKQACAYRDDIVELDGLDAVVIGVSGDEAEGLALFKKAHNLNFSLLSDSDGEIAALFGVPSKKALKSIQREIDGKEFILKRHTTTSRWTFIVDKKGKLVYKAADVNAQNDSQNVISELKQLKK